MPAAAGAGAATGLAGAAAAPSFPPLLRGRAVPAGSDPLAEAARLAAAGTDPGLVVWADDPARLDAALVLAPEVPLARALTVLYAVAQGLGDALGALAPPEVAVQFDWPAGVLVNGAACGRLRAAASTADPAAEPDWLVLGVALDFVPPPGLVPGAHPERTWLHLEGCGELTPRQLLESWARHTLVWLHAWEAGGLAALHGAWRGRALGYGSPGFLGIDETGNRLRRTPAGTVADPLAQILERP